MVSRQRTEFEWDNKKDLSNQEKHRISFIVAQHAFTDPNRVILEDVTHSTEVEKRYFCLGKVDEGILTVRFTYREHRIRIFGAGYWRKGRRIYEEQNQL
ncbi:MAG: BrnT family toxin [Alteromonas sp.]|nr:BrnT family toxin [Alteromonas sp.]